MLVNCLNCNHVQDVKEKDVSKDENGTYVLCKECKTSFDVDYEKDHVYGENYLHSLSLKELQNLMFEYGYEEYDEFSKEELVDILSRLVE